MPLAARERLANAPAEFLVVAAHHALRAAVYERSSLLLRCWRTGSHDAFRVRELEDAVGKLLYLALSLPGFGVLVRMVRAMRPRCASDRGGGRRRAGCSKLTNVGNQTGGATDIADELGICSEVSELEPDIRSNRNTYHRTREVGR